MKNTIKLILAFLLAVIVGFGVVILVKKSNEKDKQITDMMTEVTKELENPEVINEDVIIVSVPTDIENKIIVPTAPITLFAPELVTDNIRVELYVGNTSYYYIVKGIKVRGESEGIVYTLTDSFGHEYTSDNGKFTHVAANSTGTYTVVAKNTVTGLFSDPEIITGFKVVNPVANPLTVSGLTSIIMTGDYEGNYSQLEGKLAKSISVKCSNSDYTANTIQEVFMTVLLENWIITVTSLEYNCLKQVIRINLSAHK